MGDNGRRALAYPRIEKGVIVRVKALEGVMAWKTHGGGLGWFEEAELHKDVRGEVLRLVGRRGRETLVVLDVEGVEYGFEKRHVEMEGNSTKVKLEDVAAAHGDEIEVLVVSP